MPIAPRFGLPLVALLVFTLATPRAAAQRPGTTPPPARPAITKETLQAALDLIGLTYSDSELALLLRPRGQFGVLTPPLDDSALSF